MYDNLKNATSVRRYASFEHLTLVCRK